MIVEALCFKLKVIARGFIICQVDYLDVLKCKLQAKLFSYQPVCHDRADLKTCSLDRMFKDFSFCMLAVTFAWGNPSMHVLYLFQDEATSALVLQWLCSSQGSDSVWGECNTWWLLQTSTNQSGLDCKFVPVKICLAGYSFPARATSN